MAIIFKVHAENVHVTQIRVMVDSNLKLFFAIWPVQFLGTAIVSLQIQVQQSTEGEYDVRLCVEEAGLIVTRLTTPSTTCSITLTSPIVRENVISAASGMMDHFSLLITSTRRPFDVCTAL